MRRTDREIRDEDELFEVLEKCDVLRIALNSDSYPYIVPLSFGIDLEGKRPYLYVHGAKEGMRHDLMAQDWRLGFEADRFERYIETPGGISCIYESIVGFGRAEAVTGEEARHGLDVILKHCGYADYRCPVGVEEHTSVWRITISQMTGKRRSK